MNNAKNNKGYGAYAAIVFIYVVFVLWLAFGFSHPAGIGYLSICLLISIISFVLAYNPWDRNIFNPIKFASLLYGMSFGVGPLILGPYGGYRIKYLGDQMPSLITSGALLALVGLFCLIIGYLLSPIFLFKSRKINPETLSRNPTRKFFVGGVIVLVFGCISYMLLVGAAGGLRHFLSYSGGRADIFQGAYGGLFWACFFLISGLSVIGSSIVSRRPLSVLLLGLFVGALFALFQGRAAAIAPFLVSTMLIHYGYKKLSSRAFVFTAVFVLFFASLLGVYRVADDKDVVVGNFSGFVAAFFENAHENLLHTMGADIERLDILAVVYKYVSKDEGSIGGKHLIGWMSPLDRMFLNGRLELKGIGPFVNGIVNPHLKHTRTGALVSLPGEFYIAYGIWGIVIGQFLYGVYLKQLSSLMRQIATNSGSLALLPYITFVSAYMVIAGTVQLFYLCTVILGIYIAIIISGFSPDKRKQVVNSLENGKFIKKEILR